MSAIIEGKIWCEWCQDYTMHTDEDCAPCGERIAGARPSPCGECERLRAEVERLRKSADFVTTVADDLWAENASLRAENERLLGIIASIKAYCDKSKWRMRGRGAPTLQGQDMAYTHVLNYIDQLERNAALRGEGE